MVWNTCWIRGILSLVNQRQHVQHLELMGTGTGFYTIVGVEESGRRGLFVYRNVYGTVGISRVGAWLTKQVGTGPERIYIDARHTQSDIVFVVLLPALAFAVEGIKADSISVLPCGHSNSRARRLVVFQEISELLLSNVDGLVAGGVGHLHHRPKKIKIVSNVGAARKHAKHDKQDGIAQN